MKEFDRIELIVGKKNINKIRKSNVIIFGIGGVGSYAVEALVRSGIENITLVDYDIIDITNFNRHIHATISTIGKSKVNAMADRIHEINSNVFVKCKKEKYCLEKNNIFFSKNNIYDYVIDAIDDIKAKIDLALFCYKNKIKLISSMGTGNKFDPTKFCVADLFDTHTDPIARIMRKNLKKIGVKKLKVVFSIEKPLNINIIKTLKHNVKKIIGSTSYVPGTAGLIIASEIINDLIKN